MIHHCKATSQQQQKPPNAKYQKTSAAWHGCSGIGEHNQLFHQHPTSHTVTKEASHVAASQDIPYVDETPDQRQSSTTSAAVDNGLKNIPQISVATDLSVLDSFDSAGRKDVLVPSGNTAVGMCTNIEATAPTTILSASTIGDVSVSPCQMAHVVQPASPCVTVKRRNIFSCCSRKRGQPKRRASASMSLSPIGCCGGQHVPSGKNYYNSKVLLLYILLKMTRILHIARSNLF